MADGQTMDSVLRDNWNRFITNRVEAIERVADANEDYQREETAFYNNFSRLMALSKELHSEELRQIAHRIEEATNSRLFITSEVAYREGIKDSAKIRGFIGLAN